ncbi:hypothetical protein HK096_005565 [Nowakowskiella sp. JEL0078]|nr:hypothetical protein HK096_005565 [Nowakowskiella sp. JEL0078]
MEPNSTSDAKVPRIIRSQNRICKNVSHPSRQFSSKKTHPRVAKQNSIWGPAEMLHSEKITNSEINDTTSNIRTRSQLKSQSQKDEISLQNSKHSKPPKMTPKPIVSASQRNQHFFPPPRFLNTQQNCYLNSILQCLLSIPELVSYFYTNAYQADLNTTTSYFKGQLANTFAAMIQESVNSKPKSNLRFILVPQKVPKRWNRTEIGDGNIKKNISADFGGEDEFVVHPPVDPIPIKNVLQKRYVAFGGSQQQDASEFLEALLEGLIEGVLSTQLICSACHVQISDTEIFRQLTLSLPLDSMEPQRRSQIRRATILSKYSTVTKTCSLFDCLKEFGKEERIHNSWRCDSCEITKINRSPNERLRTPELLDSDDLISDTSGNSDVLILEGEVFEKASVEKKDKEIRSFELNADAILPTKQSFGCTKRRRILKLPEVLVIHLNRFMWQDISTVFKIGTIVEFPNGTDIGGFVFPVELMTNSSGDLSELQEKKYTLFAVCSHAGDHAGGHYTAYRKVDGIWCLMDDDRPLQEFEEQSGEDQVYAKKRLENSAFILMYRAE